MNAQEADTAARSLHEGRVRQGWRPAGRKIGFTNRAIWPRYGVHEPIWGFVYRKTLIRARNGRASVPLAGLTQPRIEPEICFGLKRTPLASDPQELLACLEWVAHAIEIVQCPLPAWKGLTAAVAVAENGLHGRLVLGRPHAITAHLHEALPRMEMILKKADAVVDRGVGETVLGSPLLALGHLVDSALSPPLSGGELVTTGTLTDAHPVAAGERWSTQIRGLDIEALEVEFQ